MLSLESELEQLRPTLGDARADALIARERREVFSLYPELRIAAWAGAMLLATAAGIVLKNNLERIGPVALATLMALASIACYAWVWWRRARATIADDYVLLLGALLLSGDLAFIESQFHLLDRAWPRHFLILAVLHGVGAYAYRSRMLLSLSISALAAWMGIERTMFVFAEDFAPRAFATAGLVLVWRELHRRLSQHSPSPGLRPPSPRKRGEGQQTENVEGSPLQNDYPDEGREFLRVFEHFAANLTLWGALSLLRDDETFYLGSALAFAIAAFVIWWGFRQRAETFVLYGFIYALIAADAPLLRNLRGTPLMLAIFFSMIAAVVVLIFIRTRFHERRA
jgi:hypothetical protein